MAHFRMLDDPRVERATQHLLLDINTIALCAVICGADTWVEVEECGHAKQTWLATFLGIPHGIPSHDTVGRVCAARDAAEFATCFRGWVTAIAARTGTTGQVIALDGKTVRRSHTSDTSSDNAPRGNLSDHPVPDTPVGALV